MGKTKKKKSKGKGGATDGGGKLQSKALAKEAKRQRQEKKANQKNRKERTHRDKHFFHDEDKEDIAELVKRLEHQRAAVETPVAEVVPQPSPRAHASFTLLPNQEIFVFGGERYDGQQVHVFGDAYRWNVDKNVWRRISSPQMPKARCSHQAVLYKDSVYVFGGEFSTFYQFFHYKDFWRYCCKSHVWTKIEVQASTDVPQARSGHRMVVWRNLLLLFGGFHDTTRETRYFNDFYIFSFTENKWRRVDFPPHASLPAPRSGCVLQLSASHDQLLLHGGFAKVLDTAKKVQGKTYTVRLPDFRVQAKYKCMHAHTV